MRSLGPSARSPWRLSNERPGASYFVGLDNLSRVVGLDLTWQVPVNAKNSLRADVFCPECLIPLSEFEYTTGPDGIKIVSYRCEVCTGETFRLQRFKPAELIARLRPERR